MKKPLVLKAAKPVLDAGKKKRPGPAPDKKNVNKGTRPRTAHDFTSEDFRFSPNEQGSSSSSTLSKKRDEDFKPVQVPKKSASR